jgi:mRNA interferase MazF
MKKGDVWLVDLTDGKGHEQKGERPAIILGGANGLYITVPLTTNSNCAKFSFTETIEPNKENGLSDYSVALVFQLAALDKKRFRRKMGQITGEKLKTIDCLIEDLLGLQK